MADHNCKYCGKPIILVPSAEERAKKYGNSPEFYRKLFTAHNECILQQRNAETAVLMAKHYSQK